MLSGTFGDITHTGRIKTYGDGSREIMACSKPVFRQGGWEARKGASRGKRPVVEGEQGGDLKRAVRRARSQVRDLALCNPFTHFVTLTLDQTQVDRYDMASITRKLNAWLSNQVQRRGLIYVLVPERHKDGAVHFHGFFNDALEMVDSGTMVPPGGGKPRKPRSKAQRAAWAAQGGHVVYNLPGWSLGFTTAMRLYGDYHSAVAYVCKYIGKDMDQEGAKIGGRWYYSGGALARPEVEYADLEWRDLAAEPGAYLVEVPEARAVFVILRTKGGEDHGLVSEMEGPVGSPLESPGRGPGANPEPGDQDPSAGISL